THPAIERSHALLEYGLGRVHDAGVDVAEFRQTEKGGGMGRVPKDVAGRSIDWHRSCPRGRVGHGSGVNLAGLEAPVGHLSRSPCSQASNGSRDRGPRGKVAVNT